MDGIRDYIEWYGEFSFKEKALTEVDNFILVRLCYLLMQDIDLTNPKTFSAIVDELKCTTGIQGAFFGKEELVEQIAATKRFGTIKVVGHEDVFDAELSAQFSAMTFDLTDEDRFIAFRGTDDTLAGWKEDFMISFTETEAQKRSLEYLRKYVDDNHTIFVAGHSKGANLALYAAAYLESPLQDRLERIYMNDGPGLCPDVCDVALVEKIKDRAVRFCPEYSIFGKLFEETQIPEKIVKSSLEGVNQHDPFSWGVLHGKPLLTDTNATGSIFINQVLDQWIESVPNEKRVSFVNDLFSAIDKAGFMTTGEIAERGPFAVEKILIELLALDKATVKTFMKLPATAAIDKAPDGEKVNRFKEFFKRQEWLPYVGMIIVGAILLVVHEYILQIGISLAFLALIIFEVGVTIKHLHKAKWNLQEESARVYICIAMIGIFAVLWLKEDAIFVVGSVLIGGYFLAWAYRNAIAYKNLSEKTEKKERRGEKIKLIVEVIMLIILGAFILVAPSNTLTWYMLVLGGVFLVDGIVNLALVISRR